MFFYDGEKQTKDNLLLCIFIGHSGTVTEKALLYAQNELIALHAAN